MHVLEHYNLTSMTLEYRRECRQSNLLESLTSTSEDSNSNSSNRKADMEHTHLLRMQADKAEIVRARTEWKSKLKHEWCDFIYFQPQLMLYFAFLFFYLFCFLLLYINRCCFKCCYKHMLLIVQSFPGLYAEHKL
jgi:hypothetical protein